MLKALEADDANRNLSKQVKEWCMDKYFDKEFKQWGVEREDTEEKYGHISI